MRIRGEPVWCERCTAPEVHPENVPVVHLFLDALPSYRLAGGMGATTAMEGFDRAEIVALMDLRGIAPSDRPATWDALRELEAELRAIRAARAKE